MNDFYDLATYIQEQAAVASGTGTTMSDISYLPTQVGVVQSALRGLKKVKKKWNLEILEGEKEYTVNVEDKLRITVLAEHWASFQAMLEGALDENTCLDLSIVLKDNRAQLDEARLSVDEFLTKWQEEGEYPTDFIEAVLQYWEDLGVGHRGAKRRGVLDIGVIIRKPQKLQFLQQLKSRLPDYLEDIEELMQEVSGEEEDLEESNLSEDASGIKALYKIYHGIERGIDPDKTDIFTALDMMKDYYTEYVKWYAKVLKRADLRRYEKELPVRLVYTKRLKEILDALESGDEKEMLVALDSAIGQWHIDFPAIHHVGMEIEDDPELERILNNIEEILLRLGRLPEESPYAELRSSPEEESILRERKEELRQCLAKKFESAPISVATSQLKKWESLFGIQEDLTNKQFQDLREVALEAVATATDDLQQKMKIEYADESEELSLSTCGGEESNWYKFWILTDGMVIPVESSHRETAHGAGVEYLELLETGALRGLINKDLKQLSLGGRNITVQQRTKLIDLAYKYGVTSVYLDVKSFKSYGSTPIKSPEQLDYILTYGPYETSESKLLISLVDKDKVIGVLSERLLGEHSEDLGEIEILINNLSEKRLDEVLDEKTALGYRVKSVYKNVEMIFESGFNFPNSRWPKLTFSIAVKSNEIADKLREAKPFVRRIGNVFYPRTGQLAVNLSNGVLESLKGILDA